MQPLATLNAREYQYPSHDHPGSGSSAKLQERCFPSTAPASKRHAGAQREQKAGAMKEPACQCQPVIDAQKGQEENRHLDHRKPRCKTDDTAHHEDANQGDSQKENRIDDW